MAFRAIISFNFFLLLFHSGIDVASSTCSNGTCPITCTGCPVAGSGFVTVDPSGPPHPCQEVLIESSGYPNGYSNQSCAWEFDTGSNTSHTAFGVTILDFDGDPGDTVTIEYALIRSNGSRITGDLFNGNTSDFNALTNPTVSVRGHELSVVFTATQQRYNRRGFSMRILFADAEASAACSSTDSFNLTSLLPSAAIVSPNHPDFYHENAECYYTVTCPADQQIVAEFIGILDINAYEDFLYVYDTSDTPPVLIRLLSDNEYERFEKFHTGTHQLQLAFVDYPGNTTSGFFLRVSFEARTDEACSGRGTNNDQCACPTMDGGDHCEVVGNHGFTPITQPTDTSGLSHVCGGTIVNIQLDYTSSESSSILGPSSYFPVALTAPQSCRWDITAPEDSHMSIIFRGFDLLSGDDSFSITYNDGRGASGFFRYSSDVTNLPVTTGQTVSLLDTPLIFDSNNISIEYRSGDSTDFRTNPGVLFEVRLLGVGTCDSSCLNGGECEATCSCTSGHQGQFCEQTIPPDYTCVVKNFYIHPSYAYPTSIYAIAGTNSFSSSDFDFNVYQSHYQRLPTNSRIVSHSYGRELILPAECKGKEDDTCRVPGLFACLFNGNEFVSSEEIPVLISGKSDIISPLGRLTKTVSIDDDVTFSVLLMEHAEYSVRWRHNGKLMPKWSHKATVTITNVTIENQGIYESFLHGKSNRGYDVVTYRLIVRACPDGVYGPPLCNSTCPDCKNGGSCHDIHGTCVCPPAYGGDTCNELLNQDTVGRNTSLTCPDARIAYPGCKHTLFCLPDPGGCMCMPGWTGPACDIACPSLNFGLDCQFNCRCDSNGQCDAATGECPAGCGGPHTGPNCQD